MNPPVADTRPVFRIDHPDVKSFMNVPMEAGAGDRRETLLLEQLQPKLEALQGEARRVNGVEASKRSTYEQAVLRLWNAAITLHAAREYDRAAGRAQLGGRVAGFPRTVSRRASPPRGRSRRARPSTKRRSTAPCTTCSASIPWRSSSRRCRSRR